MPVPHPAAGRTPARRDRHPPSDWRAELDRIEINLVVARPHYGDHYHHVVLLFTGPVLPSWSATAARLLVPESRIRHWVPFARPAGGHVVHVVLDDYPWESADYDFVTYASSLQTARKVLKAVPKAVLPSFLVPPLADALDESLVAWFSCMHWLAQSPRCPFISKLEYLETPAARGEVMRYRSWVHCPALADFDPVPILASTAGGHKDMGQWRAEHVACGRPFPEVIAARITKPLWLASLFALQQLLRSGIAPTPAKTRRAGRKVSVHPDTVGLHDLLSDHHLPAEGETRFDALSVKEMERRLGLKQWDVSRRMKELMALVPDSKLCGMDAYKALCRTGSIKLELLRLGVKIHQPNAGKHFLVDDMNQFEDPKSPRPGRD